MDTKQEVRLLIFSTLQDFKTRIFILMQFNYIQHPLLLFIFVGENEGRIVVSISLGKHELV